MLSQKVVSNAIKGRTKKKKFRKKIALKLAGSAGSRFGHTSSMHIAKGIVEVSKDVADQIFDETK